MRSISTEKARERAASTSNIGVTELLAGGKTRSTLLYDIWRDRRVILAFLRHFGCRFCAQQVAALSQLAPVVERYNKRNPDKQVHIVAIGFGTIKDAQSFLKLYKFKGELYVDQSAATYDAFKLDRGEHTIFANREGEILEQVKAKAVAAAKSGFKDYQATAEPKPTPSIRRNVLSRVGGCFVLGPGNTCDYSYRSKFAGDHPDLKVLYSAATGTEVNDIAAGDDGDDELTYVYPTTKEWVRILKGGERHEDGSKPRAENDENYLERLREDAEGRVSGSAEEGTAGGGACPVRPAPVVLGVLLVWAAAAAYAGLHAQSSLAGALAAAAGVYVCALGAGTGTSGREGEPGDDADTPKCPFAKLQLLTPVEIDTAAERLGNIKCDCSVATGTDWSDMVEDERARSRSASGATAPAGLALLDFAAESVDDSESVMHMLEMNCYMREFLAKPHPLVGRKGPVCPFVPAALRYNSMYFSVVRTGHLESRGEVIARVKACARSFVTRFHELEPTTGRKVAYKAVVLVFPDVPLRDAHEVIDNVQLELKPEFVAKGLMLGEFHKHNNACGLRNPNFYPLRTPSPALAVRRIVPTDLVFLSPSKYPSKLRLKFLQSYLEQFEGDQSAAAKKAVAEATVLLDGCKMELNEKKKGK